MRKLTSLFMMSLAWIGVQAYAETVQEDNHFFCGFDTEDEFNLWTVVDVNGLDGNGNNACWWDRDYKAAIFNAGISKANDEWLISPSVKLSGGKNYAIKVKMLVSDPGKLSFSMGKGGEVADQTVVLRDTEEYASGSYYLMIPLQEGIDAGDYYFGMHCTTGSWYGPVYVQSFEVAEYADATVEGVLLNKETRQPVAGAAVTLTGRTYEATTVNSGDDGAFRFEKLGTGTYTVRTELDGYETLEQTLELGKMGTTNLTLELVEKLTSQVSGTVVDEMKRPIQGAEVVLRGVQNFSATTDAQGLFVFEEVRREESYQLTVAKDWKLDYSDTVEVREAATNLGEIVMETYVSAPINLHAEAVEPGALLSWVMPIRKKDFVLDNGTYVGVVNFTGGDYSVAGNIFNEPMVVENVSWLLSKDGSAKDKVDLYIYLFDKDGSLSTEDPYEAKGVPNKNYEFDRNFVWNTYQLPEPIAAPYGCVVAVGCEGVLSICSDYANVGHSITKSSLESGFRLSSSGTFFIRAGGSVLVHSLPADSGAESIRLRQKNSGMRQSVSDANGDFGISYKVWRFRMEEKANQEAWKELEKGDMAMNYTDRGFDALEQGVYQYAVQAAYPGGVLSELSYSNELPNKVFTSVTVNVYTDSAIDFSDQALVTLANEQETDLVYTAVAEKGQALFPKVRKGIYTVTVSREGFEEATSMGNAFDMGNAYGVNADLTLIAEAPFALQAEQQPENRNVLLRWNVETGIFDDFEAMDDFAVNPAGEVGWTYADVDGGTTYGIKQCEASPYPNMFSPMAYMAFNPTATKPSVLEYVQPYSGKKVLVSVAVEDGGRNDDYLFSPELSFDTDFTLSFHAASGFYGLMGWEEFMVGYAENEARPDDVVWLTESPQAVGGVWTPFEYMLPKEAKYAVIRCVSDQRMFFMLDDVFIGRKEADIFAMTTFNVTLDGEDMGTTNLRSFSFENLSVGKHLAKVQTVYPMADGGKIFSDFAELMFVVEPGTGIESQEEDALFVYAGGNVSPCPGVQQIELFDAQGRLIDSCTGEGEIGTSGLAGVYLLRVVRENGEISFAKILVD